MRRSKPTPREQYAEWVRYLEAAYAEIVEAFFHRRIFRAVREMFIKNPNIQTPAGGVIWSWIQAMYGREAVMLVRRDLDTHAGAPTLMNMLHDMEKHAGSLKSLAKGAVVPDAAEIRADRLALEREAKKVVKYSHRLLAHRTPRTALSLNNAELDDGLRAIRRAMLKYYGVLKGSDLAAATPVLNYDWLAPFRVPWLPEAFEEPELEEERTLSEKEKAESRELRRKWGFARG